MTHVLKGEMLVFGDDEVRVELGPKLVKTKATADLLDNRRTAPHYQLGGLDAYGNRIHEGQDFEYLDWGGSQVQGLRCYYVYGKFPVDHTAEFLEDGKTSNPYFVPEDKRASYDEQSTPFYTYVFCELGTAETEEEAISMAEEALKKLRKDKATQVPQSHLDHVAKCNENRE